MDTRAAHTAEHAFIGSLQKILNRTLSVRKVEHKDPYNIVFIRKSEVALDFEKITTAEKEVNRLILEGRKISHHSFSSLQEAKKVFPALRANETRLENADAITVVEIENHDLSACSMEHVNNLSECIFFLVTNMSMNGSDYEIRFMVGRIAMDEAVRATEKINNICIQIGANYNTVEATIKKLYDEREQYHNRLKKIANKLLVDTPVRTINDQNVNLITTVLYDMDWRTIQNFAGEKILKSRTIVVLVNMIDNDMAALIFARSDDLNLDCAKIFEELRKDQNIGRGGGKPNFINAKIIGSKSDKVIEELVTRSLQFVSS
ncbi:MAG TPA: DHHA1 domain-containing protein [Nitrososphaeraceae archaeon]